MGRRYRRSQAEEIAALDGDKIGKFVKKIGQLELKIMSSPKKQAVPAPEKPVKAAPIAVPNHKAKIAELEKQAQSTGDYTKLLNYERELRKQGVKYE